jgi:hypothetical protein
MVKDKIVAVVTADEGKEKDILISLLDYIMVVGIAKAKYDEWLLKRKALYKSQKDRIVTIDDVILTSLAYVYHIPVDFLKKYYNDDVYIRAENKGLNINKNNCILIKGSSLIPGRDNYQVITNRDIDIFGFKRCIDIDKIPIIKISHLFQHYKESMINNFSDDIWYNLVKHTAITKASINGGAIVDNIHDDANLKKLFVENVHENHSVRYIRINIADTNYNNSFHYAYDVCIEQSNMANFYKILKIIQELFK